MPGRTREALRTAVLLSGNGSTFQNILDRARANQLDVDVVCVLSSREGVYGLERAKTANIPAVTVARNAHAHVESFSDAVWAQLRSHKPELIVLAGFMCLLRVPNDFENRIVNVHPALIPAFCGKGMYGHHVHEAVLAYGAKITGATVHFVDNEYDHGPIILQAAVPVEDDDTADTLAERVQAAEREIYPRAIQLFAEGRLQVEGRRVRILDVAHS